MSNDLFVPRSGHSSELEFGKSPESSLCEAPCRVRPSSGGQDRLKSGLQP
jgi:hypothetical protein